MTENAALNAIRDYLEPGESAVSTAIDICHLAPIPVGQRVTAKVEVTQAKGRQIVFAVTAHDEIEEIGQGSHQRVMVDLRRLTQRLAAKDNASLAISVRPQGTLRLPSLNDSTLDIPFVKRTESVWRQQWR